jgi:glycerol uptake facilitator-like aquaporin
MILLFEFIGSMFLTCIFESSMFSGAGLFQLWIGYISLMIAAANISGSHFNPAVTLAFMFRKDEGVFRKSLGIMYIIF